VTCEGYTFQIRKAPLPLGRGSPEQDPGKLFHRIADCLKELVELRQAVDGLGDAPNVSTIQAIRQTLAAVLEQHGMHNCNLYKQVLQPLPFQPQLPAGTVANARNEVEAYFNPLLNEAAQECICSALLPPCPEPIEDNCIPLATVTVNCQSGCRIVRVCNWENRQIVPTVPGLAFWFGGFLGDAGVSKFLSNICCEPVERLDNAFSEGALIRGDADAQSIFKAFKEQLRQFL
jgi:hypothetical protein